VLFCDVCAKDTHITSNCVLPNQPNPAAILVGCGGDGLQMFSAMSAKKTDGAKAKQAVALVTVHTGTINVQQLVDGFSRMFPWGWELKAKPYMNNSLW
jgi:hypothetical protein